MQEQTAAERNRDRAAMNERINKHIDVVIVAVSVLVAAILIVPKSCTSKTDPGMIVIYDTIVERHRDTVTVERVIVQERQRYDTIVVNDTVYIADIPRVYTDSTDKYRLEVNAVKMYDYRLDIYRDSIITHTTTNIASEAKKHGKFGQSVVIGVQVGYGIGIAPRTMQAQFLPYIGVGVTYGIGYNW